MLSPKKLQLGAIFSKIFKGLVRFFSMAANCLRIFFSMVALESVHLCGIMIRQISFLRIFIDLDRYCKFPCPIGWFYLFSMLSYLKLFSSGSFNYCVSPKQPLILVCKFAFDDSVLSGDGLLISLLLMLFRLAIGLRTNSRVLSEGCFLGGMNDGLIGVILSTSLLSLVSFQALMSFLTIIL